MEEVVHSTYGSNQGLEYKIRNLKDVGRLNTRKLAESDENDKKLDFIQDPEEKKVVNLKNKENYEYGCYIILVCN